MYAKLQLVTGDFDKAWSRMYKSKIISFTKLEKITLSRLLFQDRGPKEYTNRNKSFSGGELKPFSKGGRVKYENGDIVTPSKSMQVDTTTGEGANIKKETSSEEDMNKKAISNYG